MIGSEGSGEWVEGGVIEGVVEVVLFGELGGVVLGGFVFGEKGHEFLNKRIEWLMCYFLYLILFSKFIWQWFVAFVNSDTRHIPSNYIILRKNKLH